MKIKKFKKGDIVKYTKTGAIGWESKDWAKAAGCWEGEKYTIESHSIDNSYHTYVILKEHELFMHPNHFTLVKGESK